MFTGIVEETGAVLFLQKRGNLARISIQAHKVLQGIRCGGSICTNGVCLTVTSMDACSFSADVMLSSFATTTLGRLRTGAPVNLERALRADGRLDGHIVQGHVDGVGTVKRVTKAGDHVVITVSVPASILQLMVHKGSVALDGVSLTISGLEADAFSVSIIPTTLGETTLDSLVVGDAVNVETDIIGKYLHRFVSPGTPVPAAGTAGITADFLASHGF